MYSSALEWILTRPQFIWKQVRSSFQDNLSKWPEVYAVSNRRAETVAECSLDLIWKHGVQRRNIHDRAAEFLSNVLQETAQLIGIDQLLTSGGHPQTDGLVERFKRTLKLMLKKFYTRSVELVLSLVTFSHTFPSVSTRRDNGLLDTYPVQ